MSNQVNSGNGRAMMTVTVNIIIIVIIVITLLSLIDVAGFKQDYIVSKHVCTIVVHALEVAHLKICTKWSS